MNNCLYLFLCSVLLLGCSDYHKNTYCDKGIVLEDCPPIKILKGVVFAEGDALNGSDGLQLTSDYLLVSFSDRKKMFSIFDFNANYLMEFGEKGHSENELMTCQLNKQYKDNSVVINDVNEGQLKVFNIDKTICHNTAILEKYIKTGSYSTNALLLPNESLLYIQQVEDNFKLILKKKGDVTKEVDLFNPNTMPFPTYHCLSCINKEGTILALPMVYTNQVNFYDLSTDEKYSISLYNAPMAYDDNNCHIYYCSVCTDGKFVYALYMNQTLEDSFYQHKNSEIHVFDFKGNLMHTYTCKEYLMDIDIAFDNCLYGLSCDEIVYKYEM